MLVLTKNKINFGAVLGFVTVVGVGFFTYRNCIGYTVQENPSQQHQLSLIIISTCILCAFVLTTWLLLSIGYPRLEKSEKSFKTQSELLQTILDIMADGVVVADLHGKFIVYNPSAERILGFGIDESTPDQWSETIGMFESDGVTPVPTEKLPLVRALKGETANLETFLKNRKHPKGAHIRMAGKPFFDATGKVQGGITIFTDITERKRNEDLAVKIEEVREEKNIELSAINKELESFSYTVSHDLRAPLRGMAGFSTALLEDYGDKIDTKGKEYLAMIVEASMKMGQLIDGLLALSHLTRSEIQKESINLSELASDVIATLKKDDLTRDVKFVAQKNIVAMGDKQLLRVVFVNLLSNAWKFTSKKANAQIEFGEMNRNGKMAYFIRDNGAGFDMQYSDKLFGTFQRLHGDSEFAGTGIGLATVQRIITRHGGHIWAEAKEDMGATFFFTI